MHAKAFLAGWVSLLLVFAPAARAASRPVVGKMTARGIVQVNGVPTPAEATVFGGDRIATQRDTTVSLAVAGGGQLFLPALSTARLSRTGSQTQVTLEQGGVAVVNRPAGSIVIATAGVRIEPDSKTRSAFEVELNGRQLRVLAHRGTLLVRAANRDVEVREGMLLSATLDVPPQVPSGVGAGLTGFETVAVVAAVAAGVVGLTLGVAALTRSDPQDCRAVSPTFVVTCD